jgi:cell wall-associated NlpC family hydrolase
MIKKQYKLFSILLLCSINLVFISCKSKKIIAASSSKTRTKTNKSNIVEHYAEVLKVPAQQIKNEKLYSFIDDWMGVSYRLGGMSKSGVDCSGFTTLLEREIYNKTLPRTASQMAGQVKQKTEKDLQEGDLVFFNLEGKTFSHVGIYLQNNKFVHASSSKGVVISNLKDPWYYKYLSRMGSVK